MEPFVLQLFGLFQAKLGERALHFPSDKAKALLAYLVAEGGGPLRRHHLAEFFWPGHHPGSAQTNLRSTLATLRKTLAPLAILQTTYQTIRVDLTYPAFWCDLLVLQPVAGLAPQGQRPFLEDLDRVDSAPFQAWRLARQQHYQQQITQAQQPVDQPPPGTQPPALRATHNLPLATTSFLGRETLIATLNAQITAPTSPATARLVTLVGPGGGGKTRLALEVATALQPTFADGVWFIDLAALTDPTLLPSTVIAVLGLQPQTGRPLLSLLLDWLRNKQVLLILDNCEHLLAACAAFADAVLHSCPQVRLLATSREALGMAGEQIYPVTPLTVPPPTADTVPAELLTYEAVRLFVTRATLAQPTFALTAANAPAVAQLCRRLDGIPLALELAAPQIKAMSIQTLVERLDQRFHLLDRGNRTALPRHQTLRASVDWSYALLTEAERILLRRLSIFAGGWTLAAAEAVCNDAPCPQPLPGVGQLDPLAPAVTLAQEVILGRLARLVEKSLVILDEKPEQTRYHLLETIRHYANEQLHAANEQERLGYRHYAYFLQMAGEGEVGMEWGQCIQSIARLRADLDNLRAAMLWACSHDADAACLLVGRLRWFWYYANYMSESELWYRRVLALPAADVITPGRSLAILGYATLQFFSQQLNPALFAQAIENFQTLNDPVHFCDAVLWYGLTLYLVGKGAEAQQLFSQYEALLHQSATPLILGYALSFKSLVEPDAGRAQQLLETGLALGRRWQEPFILAHSYFYLGIWAQRQREYRLAKAYAQEGLTYERMGGNQWSVTLALCQVGDTTGIEGNWDDASLYYTEALQRSHAFGFEKYRANFLARLGYVAGQQGERATAERYLTEGLALCQVYGDQDGMTFCLICYAELWRLQGHPALTVQLLAVHAVRTSPFPFDQVIAERTLTAARHQLAEDAFTAAWDAGQALTLADALALARSALGATLEQEKAVLTLRSVSM
jgi:predicted ATPase